MHVQPAHILALRLDLLRALLGPGWLGFMRHARPDASGVLDEAAGWPAVERSYSRILAWLMPGLGHVARAGRCGPLAEAKAEQAGSLGPDEPGLESAAEAATLEQPADPHDAPTRLLHLLRCGLAVSPAGIRTCAALTAEDLLHCIVPALAYLYAVHAARLGPGSRKRGARTLVVLAGMPGSGKSVLAEVIARLAMLLPDWPRIQVVGMDGWHLPNEALRVRTIQDEFGRTVPLISRKGSAASFDVAAMATSMRQLLDDPGPQTVPVYDRQLHDPVPQGLTVDAPIVLLEGNYLLMDAQGYEQIARLSDGRIWLDVPLELARRAIVRRHAAAGRSLEEAQAKWQDNDWPNSLAALRGRAHADAVILTGPRRRMRFVHRPCGATARAPVTRHATS